MYQCTICFNIFTILVFVQDISKLAGSSVKPGKRTISATMRSPGCRKCARGGPQHRRGHFLLINPNRVRTPQCLIPQQSAPVTVLNLNPVRMVPWLLSQRGHVLPSSLTTATKVPPLGPNTARNLSLGSITA